MSRRRPPALLVALLLTACGGGDDATTAANAPHGSGGAGGSTADAAPEPGPDSAADSPSGTAPDALAAPDAQPDSASGTDSATAPDSTPPDATTPPPCTTRIQYGDRWIHGPNHPDDFDVTTDTVTWDGACHDEGANSYALLSNGWKPYFTGHGGCVLALDRSCGGGACSTRVSYGPAWIAAQNHPASYDDVAGRVSWNRGCANQSGQSYATLSNGWQPHFQGSGACALSFRYEGCGGLYDNAVLPGGCADPGVLLDGSTYVVACTSGGAANAFAMFTSTDLVHWKGAGHIFPSANKPTWASGDFWAPEIHRVGGQYVAYFTARHKDGKLSIGAATSPSATGPFTDLGQPLVHDATMGMIDATELEDASATPYLVWKADGNAVGKATPIYGQKLSASGTALTGSRVTLITNDLGWEGNVVEGPFVVSHGGQYVLFYSGNAYYNGTYAVGVARSSSPLGPYTKLGAPILTSNAAWIGPGHCSVVPAPSGETELVYHAWAAGHVNGAGDARLMLVDRVDWSGGWPSVPEAPSSSSRPMP